MPALAQAAPGRGVLAPGQGATGPAWKVPSGRRPRRRPGGGRNLTGERTTGHKSRRRAARHSWYSRSSGSGAGPAWMGDRKSARTGCICASCRRALESRPIIQMLITLVRCLWQGGTKSGTDRGGPRLRIISTDQVSRSSVASPVRRQLVHGVLTPGSPRFLSALNHHSKAFSPLPEASQLLTPVAAAYSGQASP